MRLQLRGSKVTPEQRQANDTHRPIVVAAVIGVLLLFAYLFTPIASMIGAPTPGDLAGSLGEQLKFDQAGNLWCRVRVVDSQQSSGTALLVVLATLAGAFLSAYWAPIRYKRPLAACWFLTSFFLIYGLRASGWLLLGHMAIHIVFHPRASGSRWIALVFGLILGAVALPGGSRSAWLVLCGAALIGGLCFAAHYALVPLLERNPRGALVARTILIQTPMLFAVIGAIYQGNTGVEWTVPLGLLFVFWQWQRLMVYQADYTAGDVPKDLPFFDYLSVFMTPALMTNWQSAQYVGQAYTYLDSRFLSRNKNAIVLAGLRIWGVALLYLVLGEPLIRALIPFIKDVTGVTVYSSTLRLVQEFVSGTPVSTPTVLLSTLIDQVRIYVIFGALTHFRVGAWRVLGHEVDPQYNRAWMATNLVSFWSRFAFHYREFLVRAFYYPVFFRFFKGSLQLRVFFATFVATSIGNHLWGHIPDRLYSRSVTLDALTGILRSWPYFVILGLSISLTQLYLMRKGRTRRPWTLDRRIGLDVLSAYATMQFFSIIHIFGRPTPESTLWDHVRLFLIGFGIHI